MNWLGDGQEGYVSEVSYYVLCTVSKPRFLFLRTFLKFCSSNLCSFREEYRARLDFH